MIKEYLANKDGENVGYVYNIDGHKFIVCTKKGSITLNGEILKTTNKYGKVRPYILNDEDELTY